MSINSEKEDIGEFEAQLILKAKKMSNNELREALILAREACAKIDETQIEEPNFDLQKDLVSEGVFSEELKRRELLEWALRS